MRHCLTDIFAVLLTAVMFGACASEDTPEAPAGDNTYSKLVLRVSLPGTAQTDAPTRAGDFDIFNNEVDKWGIQGENIENLRVIILDSDGNVEANAYYPDLQNATYAGKYEYKVRNHDTKTVILIANEDGYTITMPDGTKRDAFTYFEGFEVNSYINMDDLKAITLSLADNADPAVTNGKTLRKPLPITAIHSELIDTNGEEDTVEKEYVMHRAAVKYTFRIINNSVYDHRLEGIRISRVADREFLFPNAEYTTNEMGHQVIKSYQTPENTIDTVYRYEGLALDLDKQMSQNGKKAVEVASVYVPEGKTIDEMYKVSITLNGAPLDMWGELKWRMAHEPESAATTEMKDLPRNTHVVVNITIKDDNTMDFIAVVQPYSSVELKPYFGLERDPNGNVIVKRYEDGTFDVIENGDIVRQDVDGDNILKWFKDGSVYCYEKVYKDYIHDGSELDYTYYFEKDRPTTVAENGDTIKGNMIIIREKSTGGTFHGGDSLPAHEHDITDRALYVLTKEGDFDYINYNEGGKYQREDMHGDLILQVNGYQFRNEGDMHKYIGTYVVKRKDNGQEELRHYKTGEPVDWDKGLDESSTSAPRRVVSRQHRKSILQRMQKVNARFLRRMR